MTTSPYGILSFSFFLLLGVLALVLAYQGAFDKEYVLNQQTTITELYDDAPLRESVVRGFEAAYTSLQYHDKRLTMLEQAPTRSVLSSAYCVSEDDNGTIVLRCKRFD
jgi:hypothetical protein